MQPGGFGGGQGNGYPPGGFPPGGPGYPPGYQPTGAASPQQPGASPPQYNAPPAHPGAPQPAHSGAASSYGAGPTAPYAGAPAHHPGPPQQPYGIPAPGQSGGAMGYGPPQPPAGFGAIPPHAMAAQNSFGHAQSALKGAGGMMTAMKWGFVAIGGLCVIGGIVLAVAVETVTGISLAFTGVVFVVVALLVLPRFSGMLGQATAMVDGFAAKEQLAQTGIPANGRLVSVQQTGRLVNYNPEIAAIVEVHHPQLGPYQTQTTAIVPQMAIPRAQPGAPVQVRVNPHNQHDIALVF